MAIAYLLCFVCYETLLVQVVGAVRNVAYTDVRYVCTLRGLYNNVID